MKFEIKNGILEKCIPEQNETSVTVPEGVTQIGTNAFEEDRSAAAFAQKNMKYPLCCSQNY